MNLPLHPLFVHAAVVFIPLAAISAALFVVRPAWRWVLRTPTVALGVLSPLTLLITRETGEQLKDAQSPASPLVVVHENFALWLTAASLTLAAVTLYVTWAHEVTSPLPDGRGARPARLPKYAFAANLAVLLLALFTVAFTVVTGHSGAVAVWGG